MRQSVSEFKASGEHSLDLSSHRVTRDELSQIYDAYRVRPSEATTIVGEDGKTRLNLRETILEDMDLSGWDLSDTDFKGATFTNVTFDGANMNNCNLHGSWFSGKNSMRGVRLTNSDLTEAGMRYVDMTNIDISGTNVYAACFEYTIQDGLIYDEHTQWYEMKCPPEGQAFVCWKCCLELRVVQMLVPPDAKRVMATMETGRTNRVKVLSIKSIDESQSYDWAQSTVDQDFFYEVGKWLEPANGFEEDRWRDSSQGIHFFLERQQCINYLAPPEYQSETDSRW